MLKSYFEKILDITKHRDAREESYYSNLEDLLKGVAESKGKSDIYITTLPKKTEAGNPDFRIRDGRQKIIGYIEAKKPSEEQLDYIEETAQLKRYLHTFPNLILTNFFEFRLYRNGKLIDKVLVGRPYVIHKLQKIPPVEHQEEFFNLVDKFFSFSIPNTYTAKSLAIELAKRTRFLRDQVIIEELKEEEEKNTSFILGFYKAFKDHLITGLSKIDFADLYSQTITFGLFAARSRAGTAFNRKLAYDYIPHTIGLLRDVFQFISLGDVPTAMEWIIDDISEVLAVSDVHKIMHNFYKEGKGKDPIVHFYETFLAEYDPQEREKRGVYYTPEPVVSYIVNSLHLLLKERFDKEDGFATQEVTVLDPAAGTLTFLAWAAKLSCEEYLYKWGEGGIKDLIKEHILKNFYALELMMAPYAVGHLKMSFLLEELGYKLQKDDRFKLYLTNTLEMEELAQIDLPGMAALSKESHLAGKLKKEIPILVVIGNPPYSVSSANKSKFLEGYFAKKEGRDKRGKIRILKVHERGILDDYKDDVKDETNIQPLSDDYIKFIRFAHYKIEQA
ncbi:MAG: N-6 DNA methylase [bacterium]